VCIVAAGFGGDFALRRYDPALLGVAAVAAAAREQLLEPDAASYTTDLLLRFVYAQDLAVTPHFALTLPRSWVSLRWPQLRVNSHLALQAAVCVEQQPTGETVDAKLRLYDKVAHLQSGGCLVDGQGFEYPFMVACSWQ
jgi:hypothetical protein